MQSQASAKFPEDLICHPDFVREQISSVVPGLQLRRPGGKGPGALGAARLDLSTGPICLSGWMVSQYFALIPILGTRPAVR